MGQHFHIPRVYTIALDPGTHTMGVALFKGYELEQSFTLKNPYKSPNSDLRSYNMLHELEERLAEYVLCPYCKKAHGDLTYEDPQFMKWKGGGKLIEPVIRMAGMITFWGMAYGLDVYNYKVTDIKKGITGKHSASKEQVENKMKEVLPMESFNKTDHEYDAMSVGVYHLDKQAPGCFGYPLPA